jgi:hypothetical protein
MLIKYGVLGRASGKTWCSKEGILIKHGVLGRRSDEIWCSREEIPWQNMVF